MAQRWHITNRASLDHLIAHLSQGLLAGKDQTLEFAKPIDNPKTPSQIRYAHSLCAALADHHHVSMDIAKRDAKAEYGVVQIHTSLITGDRTARLISFSEYSQGQMIGFLTAMESHLTRSGIPFIPASHA